MLKQIRSWKIKSCKAVFVLLCSFFHSHLGKNKSLALSTNFFFYISDGAIQTIIMPNKDLLLLMLLMGLASL
jgi:hypothetical protein